MQETMNFIKFSGAMARFYTNGMMPFTQEELGQYQKFE